VTDFTDTTLSTQRCILFIYTVLHHELLYYLTHSSHCDANCTSFIQEWQPFKVTVGVHFG